MMLRAGLVGWLMLLTCMGCSRGNDEPEDDAAAGAGGAPSVNETPSQGGDRGGQGATCEGSGPYCLLSCHSFAETTPPECVDGTFVCPEGSVVYDSCPANACIRRTQSCCAANGSVTIPNCNDDDTIGACPEGYAKATSKCLPQGVAIEDCFDLHKGDACTDPALVCYTSKCGWNCYCKEDETGNLSWDCFELPC